MQIFLSFTIYYIFVAAFFSGAMYSVIALRNFQGWTRPDHPFGWEDLLECSIQSAGSTRCEGADFDNHF